MKSPGLARKFTMGASAPNLIHNDTVLAAGEVVVQETGLVLEVREGGICLVRAPSGDIEAARAVGCLVEPEPEDLVLLARSPREGAFVLSVLRRDSAKATIALDGDLDLRLTKGRFRVAAQEGIDLVTASTVSVVAQGLDVNAAEGSFVLRTVKVLARTLDSVLDRVSQRVQRSYRTVEETEQLRAGRVDYTADKTMSLHAEHTLVTADELVKLDGEQIHLG